MPVVYLSAFGDDATTRRARETGPFAYLLKPFDEKELEIAIEIALYRSTLEYQVDDSQRQLASVLRSIDDAVIALDVEGCVRYLNRAAEGLTGRTIEDVKGMTAEEVLRFREQTGFASSEMYTAKELVRPDGRAIPVEETRSDIIDDRGTMTGSLLVLRDVTERLSHDQERRELLSRLEESNAMLERFAFSAAHDMKEPLRAITGFGELLRSHYASDLDEEGQSYLSEMVSGADRLSNLVSDLLMISRIAGSSPETSAVELEPIVEAAMKDLGHSINENGAIISLKDLPAATGNPNQLSRLFQNLISNAIKFQENGESPEIRISAVRNGDSVIVTVRDNGIGIAEEDQGKLFELFGRLHGVSKYPGTGLGLAMCKVIVEKHGGRIWVESTPGEGSSFRFTLLAA